MNKSDHKPKYSFYAWVHPGIGGDDYTISGVITLGKDSPKNELLVRREIQEKLKKEGSAVLDDFTFRREKHAS